MSMPLTRVPKGGFMRTVSNSGWPGARPGDPGRAASAGVAAPGPAPAARICARVGKWATSQRTRSGVTPTASQLARAAASALSSTSTPTTCAAPTTEAPMANIPVPQPKSATAFPSKSPNEASAAKRTRDAMCGDVGYCSSSTSGSWKGATRWSSSSRWRSFIRGSARALGRAGAHCEVNLANRVCFCGAPWPLSARPTTA